MDCVFILWFNNKEKFCILLGLFSIRFEINYSLEWASIISWTECFQLKNRTGLKAYAFVPILALYIFTHQVYICNTNRNLILLQSQRPSSIGGLSQAKSRAGAPDQCETKKDNSEIPEIPTSENMGVRRASLDEWRSSSGKPSLLTQSSLKSDIQDVMSNIKKQSNQG